MMETIVWVVIGAIATPFVLYLSAKLVAYGLLAGRDQFYRQRNQKPGE